MTRWIEIGALDDIPRLGARVVRTASGDIAVFRTEDDEVFALDDRCPHKGGPLSQGIVHNKRVTCPLHKEGLHAAGVNYPGHTEILADRTGAKTEHCDHGVGAAAQGAHGPPAQRSHVITAADRDKPPGSNRLQTRSDERRHRRRHMVPAGYPEGAERKRRSGTTRGHRPRACRRDAQGASGLTIEQPGPKGLAKRGSWAAFWGLHRWPPFRSVRGPPRRLPLARRYASRPFARTARARSARRSGPPPRAVSPPSASATRRSA